MQLIAGFVIYLVILAAAGAFTFARGGADEKAAMTACLAAAVFTEVAGYIGPRWERFDWFLVTIDAALFIALVAIAHRSRRFWPIWAAAFQMVGLITHPAVALQATGRFQAYATLQPIWAFPVLATILTGAWRTPGASARARSSVDNNSRS